MLELLDAQIIALVGVVLGGGSLSTAAYKWDNKAGRYSPADWANLWHEKRNWLALAAQGKQPESNAEALTEIASILQVAGKPLKGHQTWHGKGKGRNSLYKNMYLTLGLHKNQQEKWSLTTSVKWLKDKPNATQEVIVNGLNELARLSQEVPTKETGWHNRVRQMVCEQASHYLLLYSASPTNMKETLGRISSRQFVQESLNASVQELIVAGKDISSEGSIPTSQTQVLEAQALVRELELSPAEKELSLGALTDEEFSLIQSLRASKKPAVTSIEVDAEASGSVVNGDKSDNQLVLALLQDQAELNEQRQLMKESA